MRVVIAGSRRLAGPILVQEAVDASGWKKEITAVVSGRASGIDKEGELWALVHGVPVSYFPAQPGTGESFAEAAKRRNQQMADSADALIAIWDGESRGTADMIARARARGLRVYIHIVEERERAQAAPPSPEGRNGRSTEAGEAQSEGGRGADERAAAGARTAAGTGADRRGAGGGDGGDEGSAPVGGDESGRAVGESESAGGLQPGDDGGAASG